MTATRLLAELRAAGCEPSVDGSALTFDADPPDRLAPHLAVLHTGVRAVLTGRRWFALDPTTGKGCGPFPARGHGPLAFAALDPGRPIPPAAAFLYVEGDERMDRLPVSARRDHPDLFAPDIATPARIR